MNSVLTILGGLSVGVGVLGTLMLIVFALACAPNSSPEQLRAIKLSMLGFAVLGLICLGFGVALLVWRRPIWAGLVGGSPMIILVVGMLYLSFKSGWK